MKVLHRPYLSMLSCEESLKCKSRVLGIGIDFKETVSACRAMAGWQEHGKGYRIRG